jgi:archaellum component FlaC
MSYDIYTKKRWDKAKYKFSSMRNDASNVANDTIGVCNTLDEISREIINLRNAIDSSSFKRKASEVSYQVDNMNNSFGRISSSALKDLHRVVNNISNRNNSFGGDVKQTLHRLDIVDNMLERYGR